MLIRHTNGTHEPRRGSSIVLVVLLAMVLAGISLAMVSMTGSGFLESRKARESMRAFELAEAGLNEAWATLEASDKEALAERFADPVAFGSDQIEVEVTLGNDDPDLASDRLRITSRAWDGRTQAVNVIVARAVPNGIFRYAVFGSDGVVMESNSLVDSYDSTAGPYDSDNPGELADVGSNEDIELQSNTTVYGNVMAGPDGVVDQAAPGSTVLGVISSNEDLVDLDPIAVPSIGTSGSRKIRGTKTIGPGDIHLNKLLIDRGGELSIVGPARIVLDDFVMRSNSALLIDASGGPVEIHCTGDVELRSNSDITTITGDARDVLLNVAWDPALASTYDFELSSNASFQGVIYAPETDLVVGSNFEIYGAAYGASLLLESNAGMHFDENLLFDDGVPIEYEVISWSKGTPDTN
ncbi:MAG: hypothetical protein ACI8QS_001733 [Planctomycetota bacterium]|jgi:hypothetical protein